MWGRVQLTFKDNSGKFSIEPVTFTFVKQATGPLSVQGGSLPMPFGVDIACSKLYSLRSSHQMLSSSRRKKRGRVQLSKRRRKDRCCRVQRRVALKQMKMMMMMSMLMIVTVRGVLRSKKIPPLKEVCHANAFEELTGNR